MNQVEQYLYGNYGNKSETYRKLESLCQDVIKSWRSDSDETNSMKEIIQIIDGMLIMTSLEDYFQNNKTDLDYFMGDFAKEVISNILYQPIVYGENGDDIALDLIFHFIKLFMHFHKNKEYSPLFERIRKIFSKETNSYFRPHDRPYRKELNPKKEYTYQQFNDEFCRDFKKNNKEIETFNIGDKVDILINYFKGHDIDRNAWVRGIIIDKNENEYIIEYPNNSSFNNRIKYPIDSPNVIKEGIKTEDWEWRLNLKENDVIDCYDRCKWYPATVCHVEEYKKENDLIYKEYVIGFRLYPDNFVGNSQYDYDTYIQNTIFWDNNDNVDKNGNVYYGDGTGADETIAFYSKRIQKFQKYSALQRECLNNQLNNLLNSMNNYNNNNNSPKFGAGNVISFPNNQKNDGEDRIRILNELLENDKNEKNIDEEYYYEKDNKKNYIIGKDTDEFSYYFAKLLKMMADNGYFEEMINILKDKPNIEELFSIFYILMHCTSYIHKDFYKQNYDLFKNAFFDMMDNLSSKEIRSLQKEVTELASNFFIKINHTLSPNKNLKTEDMDEINLTLALKMIKSSIFDKKIQGLKSIGEYIKTVDEKGKKYIINLIKKYDIIKDLFGTNYHTQIISKSNDILELMIKNNELTDEEIKIIWSLTKQGDLEAKMTIIKLLSDLKDFFNDKYCNILLDYINNEKDKNLNENIIDLVYNLAIKANNEQFMIKCCDFYCNNLLEINNLSNLSKSPHVDKIINIFSKGEKYAQIVIDNCENNLKQNKNVLAIFFLLDKLIEKYKKNININTDNNNEIIINEDFINKIIHNLIDNEKLLNLFKENFLLYKKRAKENVKENQKENNLIIDGYTHEENMKNRILFLIQIIPVLYPKFNFFELLKEICRHEPVFQSDKSFFYDFMKKYLYESSSNLEKTISKEQKITIETQLFNMLTEENKNEMTLSQYNLYIELFLDINSIKDFITIHKFPFDDFNINIHINYNVNIEDIFGIENLWNLLFELNKEELIQKLITFIYNLYKNKDEIQKLIDKCVKIIKDIENLTYNKLEKCINILKFIILDTEKNGYIKIKSHFSLLKDFLINIPLELKKKKNNNNDLEIFFNQNKENENKKDKTKNIFFGNTNLMEIKLVLAEKNHLEEKNIHINFSYKENKSLKNKTLDSSYNNKTVKEVLNINTENCDNIEKDNKNNNTSSNKLVFTGDLIEKESFLIFGHHINPKFDKMIKQWFSIFSKGNELMEKDQIFKFISRMHNDEKVDENNINYINFMREYDKAQKDFILESEFCEYYNDLARKDSDKIREDMKAMKYRDDFEKSPITSYIETIDKNKLPRYILGNDKDFHKALIDIFLKFEKKMNIYEFLFFLCTNEAEYNELLNDFQIIFKEENTINYLEQLYQLIIMKSFIQDLEISQLDLDNNKCKIDSGKYIPFDEEPNLDKKILFFRNFIENKGYEKLINYIENLINSLDNNNVDEEKIKYKCCQIGLNIINIIYSSFIEKNNNKVNFNKNDIFYLNNYLDINKILDLKKNDNTINDGNKNSDDNKNIDDNKIDDDNKTNKLKEIVLNTPYLNLIKTLVSFLIKTQNTLITPICKYCFDLLVNLITSNQLLSEEIQKNDTIRANFSLLLNNNINSPINSDKFFIKSLIKFITNLSKTKTNSLNKLEFQFINFLFEISNSELINIKNNEIDNKEKNENSYFLFYDFFSILLKVFLNNNINHNINQNIINEVIFKIYDLIYEDLKEEKKGKKLSEDAFLGFMKILITAINNDKSTKNQIINKKINDETLFEIIYKKILPNNQIKKEQNDNDDCLIDSIIESVEDKNIDKKFLKIETCNELKNTLNVNNQNKNEDIITQKVYDIFNEFLLVCLKDSTEPELVNKFIKMISSKKQIKNMQNNISKKVKKPKSLGYVGLKNNGCICYMNSILQQMYMVPSFRYAIMSSDDKKDKNMQSSFFNNNRFDDNLLHQLQKMYTFLTYSEKQDYNPKDFCASFKDFDGAPINPLIQQDSQEFFNNFCDKIENCLKNTKYKYIIDNIFTGKTCSSVICEKCKTLSNRFENFYNLTLEVKNIGSLYESLKKLIVPEKIDQFNCEKCKEKVTINKITSLAKLPNVLFIHLKRFYMNYEVERTEKINSRFEFPNTLNLKEFCIEEINKINNNGEKYETDEIYQKEDEYYEYELKGINVHLGNAQGGHYISFIDVERDGTLNQLNIKNSIENNIIKSKWLRFNDSIVSEFDTKDIPIESYGGYVDNNLNNENIQNAYLLIYERKKKLPIKISIEKDNVNYFVNQEKYLYNNKVVTYGKEQKASIEKFYDISNSNKECRINEEELYKIVFCEEESKDCYVYIPYYNIDKTVLKENFIEVMKKNRKFFKNKNKIEENSKFKDECNDILLGIIHLKDFNILDNKYSLNDKKQLLLFFRDEIFENKIFKHNNIITDEEQKVIINDKTNILLENLIIPIIKNEKKDENYEELFEYIGNILLSNDNLKKIFQTRNINRIFDIKNVKNMSEIIFNIFKYFEQQLDTKNFFIKIYKLIDDINEDGNNFFTNNNIQDNNNKKEKGNNSPLYYLYDLINKIIHLNDTFIELLINEQQIIQLLSKINDINSNDIRKIIYDIITCLVDKCYQNLLKGIDPMRRDEEERIKHKAYNNKQLIKRLFNEKMDLLIKLIKIIQSNDSKYNEKFNDLIIGFLFKLAIKEKKITQMLDLLFEIINIKDEYTINRLCILMGYPEMIIIQQIKEEDEPKECSDSSDDEEDKRKKKKKLFINEDGNDDYQKFFPLFGNRLLEQSKNGEIFKYVNNCKLYETHCILAQLFPCSNDELYANINFIKNEAKLTEEERNKYIYKLLCLALLGEGNYALFKYIYLTQSRYIIKYKNLYEEIIDILSKDNKYDLTEIKQKAEICIKIINYEVKKMKDNISNRLNQNLFDDYSDINNDNNKENEEKKENIPQLPETMKKTGKYKNIKEFTGFIPEGLPDSIEKVVYSVIGMKTEMSMLSVKYYTSYKNIELIRQNEKEKEKEKEKKKEKEKEKEEKEIDEKEKNENEKNEKEKEKDKDKAKNEEEKDKEKEDKDKEKEKVKNEEEQKEKENEEKENINKIEEKKQYNNYYNYYNKDSDEDYTGNKLFDSDEENVINVNRIRISEKTFLREVFCNHMNNTKIIIFNKSYNREKKAELCLYRYLLVTNFDYRIILKIRLNHRLPLHKNIFHIPSFSLGYVNVKNYTDIISFYRKDSTFNYINKNSIEININIKHKKDIKVDNYFNEWSNSDNDYMN